MILSPYCCRAGSHNKLKHFFGQKVVLCQIVRTAEFLPLRDFTTILLTVIQTQSPWS